MGPVWVDWSAEPPSSSEVRGATDWQTGHGADALAVFYMVVTETEVTEVFQKCKKASDPAVGGLCLRLRRCSPRGVRSPSSREIATRLYYAIGSSIRQEGALFAEDCPYQLIY
jgi:hypothetical protein